MAHDITLRDNGTGTFDIALSSGTVSGPANVKTWNGLIEANVKSLNGVLLANIKTIDGVN